MEVYTIEILEEGEVLEEEQSKQCRSWRNRSMPKLIKMLSNTRYLSCTR
jgi:hypothetical protein